VPVASPVLAAPTVLADNGSSLEVARVSSDRFGVDTPVALVSEVAVHVEPRERALSSCHSEAADALAAALVEKLGETLVASSDVASSELDALEASADGATFELVTVSVATEPLVVLGCETVGDVAASGSRLSNLDTQAMWKGMAMAVDAQIGLRLNHQRSWELTGPLTLADLSGRRNSVAIASRGRALAAETRARDVTVRPTRSNGWKRFGASLRRIGSGALSRGLAVGAREFAARKAGHRSSRDLVERA
jgi:hypothetical protein